LSASAIVSSTAPRASPHARCGERLAQRGVERAVDADRLARRLHLRAKVGVDCRQLAHREHRRLDSHQVRAPAREPVCQPIAASFSPSITRVASGTIGTPVTLDRNGTVREARGLDLEHVHLAAVHDVLHVHPDRAIGGGARFARCSRQRPAGAARSEPLAGVDRIRVAGVHASTLHVLHHARDDHRVAVTDGVDSTSMPAGTCRQHRAARHRADGPHTCTGAARASHGRSPSPCRPGHKKDARAPGSPRAPQ